MKRAIEIRCTQPLRRDALGEAARLGASFIAVSTRPGRSSLLIEASEKLRIVVSCAALEDGCHVVVPTLAGLKALQSYGVPVVKDTEDGKPPDDWKKWWSTLEVAEPWPESLVLEIL